MKRLLPFLFFVGLFNLQVFAAEKYPRKIVMEEATGTWCGWCVRGIETLKLTSENYPNNFIGIGIHSGDEMANAENYDLSSVGTVTGYPGCFINRRTTQTESVDYYSAKSAVEKLKDDADAKIVASAYFTDAAKTSVIVQTKTTFGYDISGANFKIAYVVLEDNVGPYNQRNYYSGESYNPSSYMYDWTQKDAIVSIKFNDVARGIYPSVNGQQGSVPSTVKMGKANDYNYTFTLPRSISNKSNISIVTLLINSTTGEIVNADKVPVNVIKATLKLNKSKENLQKGKTLTLKATISPEILTDKSVTWESSNTAVATVTSSGKVKGVKAGTATITCTSVATGAKATCKLTVGYVKLDQSEAILEKGKTMTLTATVYPSTLTDKSVKWESSDTKVATVTSSGKVKGVKAGTATITCTSVATGLSTTCKVTVSYVKLDQSEAILEKGKTMTLTPTVYPSKQTDQSVTWESSNTEVATVASDGTVKGVKAGIATITCTSVATGLSTTCKVTVSYVKLDQSETILEKGKTMTLTSMVYPSKQTDQSVTWKSSNTEVAIVASDGTVKGVKAGIVTITCTSVATGLSTTCEVTVSYVKLDQSEAILEKGKTMMLMPTVYPSKYMDQSVTWKSSNTEVATVTSSGKVKGVKAGIATITCTSVATGLSTTCKVTVGYVKLNISEVTINKGNTITLTSTVYPSKQTDQSVTWKSSNTAVATVTSDGKVTGIKAGTATITCTSDVLGLSTTCKVTVIASSNARSLDGDDANVTGIEALDENLAVEEPFDVYDLRGRKVMQRVTSLDGLPVGVYIIKGKKVMKKD